MQSNSVMNFETLILILNSTALYQIRIEDGDDENGTRYLNFGNLVTESIDEIRQNNFK